MSGSKYLAASLSASMSFASTVAGLAFLIVCGSAVTVMAADDSQPSKSATPQTATSMSASKPMITQNPDGTFTVQKEPRNGNSKDAKVKEGLVIPPQVVVPIIPTTEKKQSPPLQQKSR
jgi:Golgi nucleoside diphosphatase